MGKLEKYYEAVPKTGAGPGVIVLQEWWGLVPHIQDVCDRLADAGFVALAPDLYHGEVGQSPDEAGRLMMALNIESAARDLGAAVRRLREHPAVAAPKVGVMGFCMGGQLALYAASRFPEIGACADFYGIHPSVKPDLSGVRCPVLGIFAEKDAYVTPAVARALEADLKKHGVRTEFTVHPGVDHAFFNDSRPQVYHAETARKVWARLLDFFRENLG